MSWVTLWLPFLSGVNRRASCMLYNYLTNNVYHFVNTFTVHGLLNFITRTKEKMLQAV